MKILLYGTHAKELRPVAAAAGLQPVEQAPEVVVTCGGDGALLGAEREFPGVPKLPLRDRHTAPLCPVHADYPEQFRRLAANQLERTVLIKLAGQFGDRRLIGINDVFIHHRNPVSAIRYG